ncbi:MAG: four-carbon acid sugar kinase family protein [Actinobacteria bacterium]|nr:four-carbon acid sugar kinase family protein [Actinomycetota bacterium]
MTRLVILADDLTGAADAVANLAQGRDVRLLLNSETTWPDCDVIALDTDTRYASPDEAAHRIAAAAGRAATAGTPVFKKIDSTLRGNLGPELMAAAAVLGTGERPALIVASPAFPAVGRTMTGGVVLVDGVPLDDDCGGSLPRRLRRDGITSVAVESPGGQLCSTLARAYRGGTAAVVVDAESDHDLKDVLQASLEVDVPVLLVGSGGLARHYDEAISGASPTVAGPMAGPTLIVLGSHAPIARSQAEQLVAGGVPLVLSDSPNAGAQLAAGLAHSGAAVLMPDPDAPVDPDRAHLVSARLAQVALPALAGVGTLVVTGGETARAVLMHAGVDQLVVRGELEPGVVRSTVPGRALSVVTKAGAFGDPGVLVRCVEAVKEHGGLG